MIIFGVILLSLLDFRANGGVGALQTWTGLLLAIVGFGAAFFATFDLGWRNAHGEPEGLKKTGWYRWSRNPIYVVSLVGMVGLGLFVNSTYLNGVLGLWALIYIVAPFLEEPWLEEKYGQAYKIYADQVPRFIGIPRRQT